MRLLSSRGLQALPAQGLFYGVHVWSCASIAVLRPRVAENAAACVGMLIM